MAGLDTDLATISAKLDLILAQFVTLNKHLDAVNGVSRAWNMRSTSSSGHQYLWHHQPLPRQL